MKENYKSEFAAILAEAIKHFDPEMEDDVSMITIVADVDNEQIVFGGLKLREDLEEEGGWNDDSRIFYTAKSKYVKGCYRTINKHYKDWENKDSYNYDKLMGCAEKLCSVMGEAIVDEVLLEKLSGKLLYGWCRTMGQMVEADNFWVSGE